MNANSSNKKVLCIDLASSASSVKTFPDLVSYLGGVGLGLKLYQMYVGRDPVVFSVGPLNGFFPFVSKTSVVLNADGVVEDIYLGGALSFRLRFAGLDAIVFLGKSKEPVTIDLLDEAVSFVGGFIDVGSLGLPGRKCILAPSSGEGLLLDGYFITPDDILGKKFAQKNLHGVAITGTGTFKVRRLKSYTELYKKILNEKNNLGITEGIAPSCSGCPLGCASSKFSELGGNILSHCLVACKYAEHLYSDASIVFSCLNVLGYDYTHEDLEKVPGLVEDVLKELEQ